LPELVAVDLTDENRVVRLRLDTRHGPVQADL
jgi:hypothetical protein